MISGWLNYLLRLAAAPVRTGTGQKNWLVFHCSMLVRGGSNGRWKLSHEQQKGLQQSDELYLELRFSPTVVEKHVPTCLEAQLINGW